MDFPSSANFLVTPKCNSNCLFCLNDWRESLYDPSEELTLEQKKTVLNTLRTHGVDFLVITGGEPMLDKDLYLLLEHGKKIGFHMIMQTNGTLIGKQEAQKLAKFLLGLQISIEGMKENHNKVTRGGNFDKSIEAITHAKEAGMIVQVNTTMTQFTKDDMREFIPLLKSKGVSRLNLIRLYYAGNAIKYHKQLFLEVKEAKQMIHDALEASKRYDLEVKIQGGLPQNVFGKEIRECSSGCGAAKTEITINYNGETSPCPSWNRSMGNILQQKPEDIWSSREMKQIRHTTFAKSCTSCPLSLTKDGDEYESSQERVDIRFLVGGKPIFKKRSTAEN